MIIGEFEIESGVAQVIDPCYVRSETFSGGSALLDVEPGRWVVRVLRGPDGRCRFVASRSAYEPPAVDSGFWTEYPERMSVDSGQIGIFDDRFVDDDSAIVSGDYGVSKGELDPGFYGACTSHTLAPPWCGVMSFGAVIATGGDGGFRLRVCYKRTTIGLVNESAEFEPTMSTEVAIGIEINLPPSAYERVRLSR